MSVIVALLLAQSANVTVNSAVFRDTDGGWTLRTTTGSAGGGPSSSVSVTNFPAVQNVSVVNYDAGVFVTNFPTTQAVSGYVNVSNFDGGVFITNLPATQPVSGSVSVSNFPASQAVTGTFWQATQPVSGTLTCNAGTGTLAVTGPLTDAQLRASPVNVTVTNYDAGVFITNFPATQPVSIAGTVNVVATNYDAGVWIASMPAPTARAVAYGASPTAVVAGNLGQTIEDLEGRPYVNTSHPRSIVCNLSTTATTSTQVTGCELVASNSIYITSITVGGGVATGATAPAIIQSGTSTACTGAVVLYRCGHVAQDTCTISFPTPIKATAGHGLCLLDATVGTKWVTITGYIAP